MSLKLQVPSKCIRSDVQTKTAVAPPSSKNGSLQLGWVGATGEDGGLGLRK